MPSYIAFQNPDGTQTLIEIEKEDFIPGSPIKAGLAGMVGDAVRVATTTLHEALAAAIRNNAQALHEGVRQITPPPNEFEITFSLKAIGEFGNVAIGKVGSEANYNVKLVWKSLSV